MGLIFASFYPLGLHLGYQCVSCSVAAAPMPQLIACWDAVLGLMQSVCEPWAALNQVHLSCPNFFA